MNQINWIKVPDINSYSYEQPIFDKEVKLYNKLKKVSSANGSAIIGCWHVELCKLFYIYHHAQNLSPHKYSYTEPDRRESGK